MAELTYEQLAAENAALKAANARGIRSHVRVTKLLLDAWAASGTSGGCSAEAVRKALLALGAKAIQLRLNVPSAPRASRKRGRRG